MTRSARKLAIIFLLLAGLSAASLTADAQGTGAQAPASNGHGIDLASMDTSVTPCQDFYQYANGKWLANNPVPADYASWGAFNELSNRNLDVLHSILEKASSDTSAQSDSNDGKLGRFYKVGMDESAIEAQGAGPLAPEQALIANVHDVPSLLQEIAHLHHEEVGAVFRFGSDQDAKDSTQVIAYLGQGGLGLPDRDYYLKQDSATKAIRDAYTAHVAKMFVLLGDSQDMANTESATVVGIETQFAQAEMSRVQLRDPNATYHKMTPADLDALTPHIRWKTYFSAIGVKSPGNINVGEPDFLKALDGMMTTVPMSDWRTYLRWHLISSTAPYLSSAFVNEDFAFSGQVLSGRKEILPRWKRVVNVINRQMGEALGQLYVQQQFSPQAKKRALAMVANLRAILRDDLATVSWMSEPTRQAAIKKLDAYTVKIGYPDKWRDYSKLAVDQNAYVLDVLEANRFDFDRDVSKIGKPVDRKEWGMTPPTVNAYYNPSLNEIVFPAGILQPPFFDPEADDAVNYGAIGAVIGHEMTHGFDDQGRQFDPKGNLSNWWTPDDEANFKARAALIAQQFDSYEPLPGTHINGELTLGENIADLGGVKIAYLALERSLAGKPRTLIDGFTPEQRFFIAFAQIWRENMRPEAERLQLATDPHSPPRYRVLGPLANTPEFAKAFGCQPSGQGGTAQPVSLW
jgi:putative endopeptidase